MNKTETTKTNKKPKPKTKPRMSLKEFIPNYRDFQREVARLEEMLGPEANIDVASTLPVKRHWNGTPDRLPIGTPS